MYQAIHSQIFQYPQVRFYQGIRSHQQIAQQPVLQLALANIAAVSRVLLIWHHAQATDVLMHPYPMQTGQMLPFHDIEPIQA